MKIQIQKTIYFLFISLFTINIFGQQVEVQGELMVANMVENESGESLVIRNTDGTLGTRDVASLPLPPAPIDTSKNLASDFELAKHMCECGTDLPPFMVKSLLESGYTEKELLESGVPYANIYNAKPILDGDGNEYSSIIIGAQTWLRENLKTTKYNDLSNIPHITANVTWTNSNIGEDPGYCWMYNDIGNKDIYGGLYNWYAVSSTTNGGKNLCPVTWHVPTEAEVNTLYIYLGNALINGNKLKYPSYDYWDNIDGANNITGFNGLGSGKRDPNGSFYGVSSFGIWWDSDESSGSNANRFYIESTGRLYRGYGNKKEGYSIRCIKD